MNIDKYGLPIKIFYSNLLAMGIRLKVKDGQLRVGGRRDLVTPVLRAEIEKRAGLLVETFTPEPSADMERYFWRLLKLDELKDALRMAEMLSEHVDALPVNGGWLLTTGKVKTS